MIELSKDTIAVIEALFEVKEIEKMKNRLICECSENILFIENPTSKGMERIRFSVIKLCSKAKTKWDYYFELAKTDWRDLFVSSGFSKSATKHLEWKKSVLSNHLS